MFYRMLAVATVALFTTASAHAGLAFNTVSNVDYFGVSGPGPSGDGSQTMAQSFSAPGMPNFNSISLLLYADNPADNGSFLIYITGDTGFDANGNSVAAGGVAGSPDLSGGGVVLGTILDSSLAPQSGGTPTLVTLTGVGSLLASLGSTANGEYWVVIDATNPATSVEWGYNANAAGAVGTNGQLSFTDANGFVFPANGAGGQGPFNLQVDTPEPATLAVLGSGLAGIGYFRRRRASKSA